MRRAISVGMSAMLAFLILLGSVHYNYAGIGGIQRQVLNDQDVAMGFTPSDAENPAQSTDYPWSNLMIPILLNLGLLISAA